MRGCICSSCCLDLLTNEKPDERQIMTYVSCYYHAFQGAMQVCPVSRVSTVCSQWFCVTYLQIRPSVRESSVF